MKDVKRLLEIGQGIIQELDTLIDNLAISTDMGMYEQHQFEPIKESIEYTKRRITVGYLIELAESGNAK